MAFAQGYEVLFCILGYLIRVGNYKVPKKMGKKQQ